MPKKSDSASSTINVNHLFSELQQLQEVLVGAYISPPLFDDFVQTVLPPAKASLVVKLSAELAKAMTDEQKRAWRQVILGMERSESESLCMRTGGLINADDELLQKFLLNEASIAEFLERKLDDEAVRDALSHANREWKKRYPVDTSTLLTPAGRPGSDAVVPYGRPPSTPDVANAGTASSRRNCPRVSVAGGFPYENAMNPEERVMWLQRLSWDLKYEPAGFRPLLDWRAACLRELEQVGDQPRSRRTLRQRDSARNLGSLQMVATNCRTRISLCSPQCAPTEAKLLYADHVASAIEAAKRIQQSSRTVAGLLSKLSRSKLDLRDLLVAQRTALEALPVKDLLRPGRIPLPDPSPRVPPPRAPTPPAAVRAASPPVPPLRPGSPSSPTRALSPLHSPEPYQLTYDDDRSGSPVSLPSPRTADPEEEDDG